MFSFYYIDKTYVDFLRQFESKVPKLDYNTKDKFFCGIVLSVNDVKYYAPISHTIIKTQTSMIIYDGDRPLSSIKFAFMIPALPSIINRINFDQVELKDLSYANLLRKEYKYCTAHLSDIQKKAMAIYKIGCNKKHILNKHCCDFKLLEEQCNKFDLVKG